MAKEGGLNQGHSPRNGTGGGRSSPASTRGTLSFPVKATAASPALLHQQQRFTPAEVMFRNKYSVKLERKKWHGEKEL